MKLPNRKDRKRRPALLPATLLLLFLALVGGTVLWLQLSGGGHDTAAQTPARVPAAKAGAETTGGGEKPHAARPAPAPAEAGTPAGTPQPAPPDTAQPPAPPAKMPAKTPDAPPAPPSVAVAVAPAAPPPQLRLPPARTGPPLPEAPDPALVEQSPAGPLPRVGLDGREPWRAYARPFDSGDKRPRIAIVIHGLGVGGAVTAGAIRGLPAAVTLGFSPYADGIGGWMRQARAAGHETLMLIPMEPVNFPVSDPGPQALMTSLTTEENSQRLRWILGRATGYVGVATYMGSRFAASRRHARVALEALKKRGLMVLDAGQGNQSVLAEIAGQIALPFATSAMFVDRKLSAAEIDARLEELETRARQTGRIIAMARPYPVTIERVAAWAAQVESRGFVLTPVSALAERARPS